jgi:hypothetical protein
MLYDGYKLCQGLCPKEYCIVVEQYRAGVFERKFHEHVPKHRLSEEALRYLLPALVMKFEEATPMTIFRGFLNDRGKTPPREAFRWHVNYPEPGVLRKYCGTDTCAWADCVVLADKFRKRVGRISEA